MSRPPTETIPEPTVRRRRELTADESFKLAGDLLVVERDRLLANAEAIERTGRGSAGAADIASRLRAAARRLMPERSIATDALRVAADRLRRARRWAVGQAGIAAEGVQGTNEIFLAWRYLGEAAEAWERRKLVERQMRRYGWLR